MHFDSFNIRQIKKSDAPEYFLFIESNRKRIARYFPTTTSSTKDLDSTIRLISSQLSMSRKKEFFHFLICDTLSNTIVGSIIIKNIDWNIQKCELGYFINKNHEGKGITTKAISLIVDHCFKALGLNKVYMRIAEDNFPSRRVAEKNSFVVEGTLRQDFKIAKGYWIDVVYYGLLRQSKKQNL